MKRASLVEWPDRNSLHPRRKRSRLLAYAFKATNALRLPSFRLIKDQTMSPSFHSRRTATARAVPISVCSACSVVPSKSLDRSSGPSSGFAPQISSRKYLISRVCTTLHVNQIKKPQHLVASPPAYSSVTHCSSFIALQRPNFVDFLSQVLDSPLFHPQFSNRLRARSNLLHFSHERSENKKQRCNDSRLGLNLPDYPT